MKDLSTTVQMLMQDYRPYHSEEQLDWFVVGRGNGHTKWGQYQQVLRELHSRIANLRQIWFGMEESKIDIDETNYKLNVEEDEFERRRLVLKSSRLSTQIVDSEVSFKDAQREFDHLLGVAVGLREELGDLSRERRSQLEADMWRVRALELAAMDFAVNGRVEHPTMELILSLPLAIRNEVTEQIKDGETILKLIEKMQSEEVELPHADVPRLGTPEVVALLYETTK